MYHTVELHVDCMHNTTVCLHVEIEIIIIIIVIKNTCITKCVSFLLRMYSTV